LGTDKLSKLDKTLPKFSTYFKFENLTTSRLSLISIMLSSSGLIAKAMKYNEKNVLKLHSKQS
jgi:hypothetical protein